MTTSGNSETSGDDGVSFNRRDILKGFGAAGALGAFGSGSASGQPPERVIVGTDPGRADVARRQATQVEKTLDFGLVGQAVVGRWPEQALQGLRRDPHVRYVEEDIEVTANEQEIPWGIGRIGSRIVNLFAETGAGVHVAILDTGIRSTHPDLAANLGAGHSPRECDPDRGSCDEDWDDDEGHGTHVAGTVGAIDNEIGVVGVAPEVTLHSVKVLGHTGSGSASDVAEGLEIAADEGYDVANMSLGSTSRSSAIGDAVEYADEKGVVLVAAAMNDGEEDRCADNDCVHYPAAEPEVIAVSNTTIDDELASTSSTGPEVDIAAPGTGILSTTRDGGTGLNSGTSMAAPHVAGAAALLLANGTAPEEVRGVLQNTAEDIGLADFEQGAGLLDVANAFGYENPPPPVAAFTYTPELPNENEEVQFDATISTPQDAIETYEWAFEIEGQTEDAEFIEAGSTPTHTYELGVGSYFTALRVTDIVGRTDVLTQFIEINAFPVAAFTYTPEQPNQEEPVTFDASDSNDIDGYITGYEWEFGDGTTETTDTPIVEHTYDEGGKKTVTLRVTDNDGASDDELSVHEEALYVNAVPVASFEVVTDPPVRDEPVTFDASDSEDPDGDIVEYAWEFGDGTTETTVTPIIEHTYVEGGEMTVRLRVTDDNGASDDELSVHEETLTVHIRVTIDVKPNENGVNPINLQDESIVPVAVLHTTDFDSPAELDPATVRFGAHGPVEDGGGAEPIHEGGHVDDVNDSGANDWHCHFPVEEAEFAGGDDEGKLVGETHAGVPVFGHDDVRIVGRP